MFFYAFFLDAILCATFFFHIAGGCVTCRVIIISSCSIRDRSCSINQVYWGSDLWRSKHLLWYFSSEKLVVIVLVFF